MGTRITDAGMTSDTTEHHAWPSAEGWHVSWLPDRVLDRNQAITAMVLAELYADSDNPDRKRQILMTSFEQELGIDERHRP